MKEMMNKMVRLKSMTITEDDIAKINQFALEPLKAENIFTFKLILGDNCDTDRNFEPFTEKALMDLKDLYIGKTVIKDHDPRTDNQVARIYDTYLETDDTGVVKLVAKAYMPNDDRNKDLIADIKAGIKKEVSTGFRPSKLTCSICGEDNLKRWCNHWPGHEYDGKICMLTIDGCSDAYETSFVSVPAQPNAGAIKNIKESAKEQALKARLEAKEQELNDFLRKVKHE